MSAKLHAGDVAVVIPAYNEGSTIADVVKRARAQVARVIVVDDGSTDNTVAELADMDITLLRNTVNCGKGASLWRGARHALEGGARAVITLDADGQHSPEDIPRVIAAAEAAPDTIVIASRLRHQENAPALRLFANRMANFWISWAAGYFIADSQSGFRLYPTNVLQQVTVSHERQHSFVFESEILIDAAWKGVQSLPVPIDSVYFEAARPSHYRATADTLLIIRMVAGRLLRKGMNPLGLLRVLRSLISRPAPANNLSKQ
ncbi:MAG: glycosyltransferase family 2 protein [Nevskiales bacterium]